MMRSHSGAIASFLIPSFATVANLEPEGAVNGSCQGHHELGFSLCTLDSEKSPHVIHTRSILRPLSLHL